MCLYNLCKWSEVGVADLAMLPLLAGCSVMESAAVIYLVQKYPGPGALLSEQKDL